MNITQIIVWREEGSREGERKKEKRKRKRREIGGEEEKEEQEDRRGGKNESNSLSCEWEGEIMDVIQGYTNIRHYQSSTRNCSRLGLLSGL